jgi:hypothetical protein
LHLGVAAFGHLDLGSKAARLTQCLFGQGFHDFELDLASLLERCGT